MGRTEGVGGERRESQGAQRSVDDQGDVLDLLLGKIVTKADAQGLPQVEGPVIHLGRQGPDTSRLIGAPYVTGDEGLLEARCRCPERARRVKHEARSREHLHAVASQGTHPHDPGARLEGVAHEAVLGERRPEGGRGVVSGIPVTGEVEDGVHVEVIVVVVVQVLVAECDAKGQVAYPDLGQIVRGGVTLVLSASRPLGPQGKPEAKGAHATALDQKRHGRQRPLPKVAHERHDAGTRQRLCEALQGAGHVKVEVPLVGRCRGLDACERRKWKHEQFDALLRGALALRDHAPGGGLEVPGAGVDLCDANLHAGLLPPIPRHGERDHATWTWPSAPTKSFTSAMRTMLRASTLVGSSMRMRSPDALSTMSSTRSMPP